MDKKSGRFFSATYGLLTGCAAIITAVASLIGACYAAGLLNAVNPAPPPTQPPPTETLPPPTQPPPTHAPETESLSQFATPMPGAGSEFRVPVVESGCPYDPRMGWLFEQNTWYGSWDGYHILYTADYFYVYDPYQWNDYTAAYGVQIPYSTQFARNAWIQLIYSPFWACIDANQNVYVVYVR